MNLEITTYFKDKEKGAFLNEGEVVTRSDERGKALIKAGVAKEVKEEAKKADPEPEKKAEPKAEAKADKKK